MQIKIGLVKLLTILFILIPSASNAYFAVGTEDFEKTINKINESNKEIEEERSIGYTLLMWLRIKLEKFLFSLWSALGAYLVQILFFLVGFAIITMALSWMFGQKIMVFKLFVFWIFMSLIGKMLVDPSIYKTLFYLPLVEVMWALPGFIIETVAEGDVSTGASPLENMFEAMDNTISQMTAVSEMMIERQFMGISVGDSIAGYILQLVYLVLQVVFTTIMALSVVAVHVLQVFLPITLVMAAIPQLRHWLGATVKHIMMFAITPTFASISMALTVMMMADLTAEAQYIVDNNGTELPPGFYTEAMFMALISIFFHIKATTFAAMVTSGMGAGFGQVFAMAMGGALGMARTAYGTSANVGGAILQATGLIPGTGPKGLSGALTFLSINQGKKLPGLIKAIRPRKPVESKS